MYERGGTRRTKYAMIGIKIATKIAKVYAYTPICRKFSLVCLLAFAGAEYLLKREKAKEAQSISAEYKTSATWFFGLSPKKEVAKGIKQMKRRSIEFVHTVL
jgi:hypothetical protein